MQQLSGMDAMFVHQETARTPMHITAVMIYDPSTAPDKPVRFKQILQTFGYNLHKSPLFRRKLATVPWNLDNPYWLEDGKFDLEYHVRHVSLPKPGDWRQFCILMARLHAHGLDMKRPLWEAYVIGGLSNVKDLPDDAFAVLLKIHHSAIDGVSAAETINAIHTLEPVLARPPRADDWAGEAEPNATSLAARGYFRNMTKPVKLIGQVSKLVGQLSQQVDKDKAARTDSRTRTRFNARISPHRVCDGVRLDLAEVKAIKNAVPNVTVNDVVIAIVGGAMRQYLQAKDELPFDSLGAAAPISVRSEDEMGSGGNQISAMTLSMRTDIENPLERLEAIHEHAMESKAYANAMGAHTLSSIADNISARMGSLGVRAITAATLLQEMPLPAHTVVSNVPGPQQPLYMSGARLHSVIGLGPLLDNMGLFHGVMSIAGLLTITFCACREMMPDPEFYTQCLQDSFDELKVLTIQ